MTVKQCLILFYCPYETMYMTFLLCGIVCWRITSSLCIFPRYVNISYYILQATELFDQDNITSLLHFTSHWLFDQDNFTSSFDNHTHIHLHL
jgi:hypothetical protein